MCVKMCVRDLQASAWHTGGRLFVVMDICAYGDQCGAFAVSLNFKDASLEASKPSFCNSLLLTLASSQS